MYDTNSDTDMGIVQRSKLETIRRGNLIIPVWFCIFFTLLSCSDKKEPQSDTIKKQEAPFTLPKKLVDLTSLNDFKSPSGNWQLVGSVTADLNTKHDIQSTEGDKVLLNLPSEAANGNLFTNFEHGDMDLSLSFMMPKGSNSGIYLQGRYEVQLLDSWKVEKPSYSDCGGIYQRWDEARGEGNEGYEGVSPSVNASKAPGLWQHLDIQFQAPRFDDEGNKISNAKFKSVKLNGFTLHTNVEVTGPTRAAAFSDEVATGPLMIQGDHGPVAFKDIRYKSYTQDVVTMDNISYNVYEGTWIKLPDFSTLQSIKSGTDSLIQVDKVADQRDHYGLVYEGNINIPVSGDYIFTAVIDDGGELFINNQSVLIREKGPGGGTSRGLINLDKGTYPFKLTYFQDVWGARVKLFYEGPGIAKKPVANLPEEQNYQPHEPLRIATATQPAIQRSFISYKNTVKTHVVSVGTPQNVHYTYDLQQGALVKFWKGIFADVHGMWHSRGHSQRLQPGNFTIDIADGLPIAKLLAANAPWPTEVPTDYKFNKYAINDENYPVFSFQLGTVNVEEVIVPNTTSDGLTKTVKINSSDAPDKYYYRIASSSFITKLSNNYYSIGGEYYLSLDNIAEDEVTVRDGKELLYNIANTESTLQFSILW